VRSTDVCAGVCVLVAYEMLCPLFPFIVIVFLVNTFIIPQFTPSKTTGETTETWPKVIAISLFYFVFMGSNIKCEHKNPEGETKQAKEDGKEWRGRTSGEREL
jgi:hypothetical protein